VASVLPTNLHGGEEEGVEHDEQPRHETNGEGETEGARDGVAVEDDCERAENHPDGKEPEEECLHLEG